MEESIRFVFRNIQSGISVERGGTKFYEYPEELIRECVNNSLAHRDYTIDKYIDINIVPGESIEIRNPGKFKELLKIFSEEKNSTPLRRIITGGARANNPKLAEILRVFDKWEGKGRGMNNLITDCLEGKIDLPYYVFHSVDELSLFIPKGKLVDDFVESMFTSYSRYIREKLAGTELTDEQKVVLAYFYKSELANQNDRWTLLLTKHNNHFNAIKSLEASGLIEKHKKSDQINSIFVVDRIFFKENFYDELERLFGEDFSLIKLNLKEVLSAIYLHKEYSDHKKISANLIGNYLYFKNNSSFDPKQFDNFKRNIRSQFNSLEKSGYLVTKKVKTKKGSLRVNDYDLNQNFKNIEKLL